MTPTPPDEALFGRIWRCFRPPSAGYGFQIARGLLIAAGLGVRPDCPIRNYSRTWAILYQASIRNTLHGFQK
eukprot:2559337-Alexandrium_andersonii.AAC.1